MSVESPVFVGAAVIGAYLLGAVSFSYVIVRVLHGIDIRTVGSGNAGATNVLRTAGRAPALLALLLDVGKGAAAVGLLRSLGAGPATVALAAVAAVLGHIYPIWMGFRGGKGVATALGTLALLVPRPTLLLGAVFVVLVAIFRYVSLGSVAAAAAAPLAVWLGWRLGWVPDEALRPFLGATAVIGAVIVLKHRENLQRLARGTESRLGQKVTPEETG